MIQALAEADAFHSLGLSRREALWAAKAITAERPLPLFAQDLEGENIAEDPAYLPQMTKGEEVVEDYVSMRLTLRAHPVALIRHRLTPGMGQSPAAPTVLGASEDQKPNLIMKHRPIHSDSKLRLVR
jgi:DNA polymerase III alpha subunit